MTKLERDVLRKRKVLRHAEKAGHVPKTSRLLRRGTIRPLPPEWRLRAA